VVATKEFGDLVGRGHMCLGGGGGGGGGGGQNTRGKHLDTFFRDPAHSYVVIQ